MVIEELLCYNHKTEQSAGKVKKFLSFPYVGNSMTGLVNNHKPGKNVFNPGCSSEMETCVFTL